MKCTKLFCGPDFQYLGSSSQTTSSLALITEYQQSMSGQEFLWLLFLDPMFRRAQEFMGRSRSCYQKKICHCTVRLMQKNIWRATSQKGLTGSLRYNISGCEVVSKIQIQLCRWQNQSWLKLYANLLLCLLIMTLPVYYAYSIVRKKCQIYISCASIMHYYHQKKKKNTLKSDQLLNDI